MDAPTIPPSDKWSAPRSDLELSDGHVHVWRVKLDQPEDVVARLSTLLSREETARAERFFRREHARRFTVVHGLLRTILAKYLHTAPRLMRFDKNEYGKPFLAHDSTVEFNLSDSRELALIAITCGRAVGIDIEHYHPGLEAEKIAARYFSPTEVARLFELPEDQRIEAFYTCWTRKEAYIKARGEGLSLGLDRFDVAFSPGERPALLRSDEGEAEIGRWAFRALRVGPGYEAACVVEGEIGELWCWDAEHLGAES